MDAEGSPNLEDIWKSKAVAALGDSDVVKKAATASASASASQKEGELDVQTETYGGEETQVTAIFREVREGHVVEQEEGLPEEDLNDQQTEEEPEGEGESQAEAGAEAEIEQKVSKEIVVPALFNVSTSSGLSPDGSSGLPRESYYRKKSVRPTVFSFENAHPAFASAHYLRTKEQDETLRRSIEGALNSPQRTTKKKWRKKKRNQLRSMSMNDIDFGFGAERKDNNKKKRSKKLKDIDKDADELSEAQESLTNRRNNTADEEGESSRTIEEEWETIQRLEKKISKLKTGIDVLKKSQDFQDFWKEVTVPATPETPATAASTRSDRSETPQRVVSFAGLSENDESEPSTSFTPVRGTISIPTAWKRDNEDSSAFESETDVEIMSSPERRDAKGKGKRPMYGSSRAGPSSSAIGEPTQNKSESRKPRALNRPASAPPTRKYISAASGDPSNDSTTTSNKEKEDDWEPALTLPKPFSFLERDSKENKIKSISTVKMEQDLLIKQAEEEAKKKVVFHAKPIPKSVLEARYNNMIKEQETIRMMKHEARKKKLVDNEKPFAFYLVDKKRQEIKQKKIREAREAKIKVKPFRANTVPSSTYEPRYELLKMEEQRRDSKIKERARKLFAESKMPPRMDIENSKSSPIPRAKGSKPLKSPVKKIVINDHIPDYKKLHKEFEEKLQKAKAKNRLKRTVVKEFHLGGRTKEEAEANQKRMEKRLKTILKDIQSDSNELKELRWPYMSTRAKVMPTKPNFDRKSTFKVGDTLAVRLRAAEYQKAKERGQYDTKEEKEARKERWRLKEAKKRKQAWSKLHKIHAAAIADPMLNDSAEVGTEETGEAYDENSSTLTTARKVDSDTVPPTVEDKTYSKTSAQHVIARHKQVAKRAQEIVEKALLAQGVDAYNFVMDPVD